MPKGKLSWHSCHLGLKDEPLPIKWYNRRSPEILHFAFSILRKQNISHPTDISRVAYRTVGISLILIANWKWQISELRCDYIYYCIQKLSFYWWKGEFLFVSQQTEPCVVLSINQMWFKVNTSNIIYVNLVTTNKTERLSLWIIHSAWEP